MQQQYVEFFSPGTFVAETTRREIDDWNVEAAVEMSKTIEERHGAKPYGFRFLARSREDNELDSKETAASCMYYIGGKVRTIEEVRSAARPDERILLTNMECNGWDRIVESTSGWKWTQPLHPGDVVLEV